MKEPISRALLPFVLLAASLPTAAGELRAGAARDEIVVEFGPQPVWLAGRGKHRPATYQNDPIAAQALYLEQGSVRLALVSVDLIGLHHHFVDRLREQLRADGVVDHLFVFATHSHSAPDTLGAWGPESKTTGMLDTFLVEVGESIVESVRVAKGRSGAARLATARLDTGYEGLLYRTRGPQVVDDRLSVLFVDRADDEARIATLINYAAHPESLAPPRDRNKVVRHAVSSDFAHYLRESVGGSAPILFANGAVGTVNPHPYLDQPPAGEQIADGVAWARRFGELVADRVVALEAERRALAVDGIAVRTERLRLPVENVNFLYGYCFGIFGDRPFYLRGEQEPLARERACELPAAELESEISLVDVGELRLLALPGEIFPEYVVGYDEAAAGGGDCPPAVERAPRGPFLRELLERDGHQLFVLGLANDEIGYIVPEYDFVVHADRPYVRKAECGRHYHETNSLGPATGRLLLEAVERLRRR
jgi:hypothetical protein